jgi:lysophospholipase L1-like esterase
LRKLIALLSASFLFVLAAAPVSANGEDDPGYLALGDSVAFGFSPLLDKSEADNFIGYPEIVAQRLDIDHVNASCSGEATGGFLSLTGTDNVCRPYRSAYPQHVDYAGTQMAFATAYLRSHPNTRLVTLTLGANDVFRYQKDCTPQPACRANVGGVIATMYANLTTIFAGIRAAGYSGLIVAVTYYSLSYDSASVAATTGLNNVMVAAGAPYGVKIASGLDAWAATAAGGSSCAHGLLIALPTPPGGCDIHPSPLGRDLLAAKVISTIAASCPALNAIACLGREQN